MKTIDINSDLGESFGAYSMGSDAQVLQHVTSANIACGFHASDPLTMVKAVRMAKEAGAANEDEQRIYLQAPREHREHVEPL